MSSALGGQSHTWELKGSQLLWPASLMGTRREFLYVCAAGVHTWATANTYRLNHRPHYDMNLFQILDSRGNLAAIVTCDVQPSYGRPSQTWHSTWGDHVKLGLALYYPLLALVSELPSHSDSAAGISEREVQHSRDFAPSPM